ncbi:MAG: hypothetical protein ABFR97_07285 [Thermodesulfobacteriota bacterium]
MQTKQVELAQIDFNDERYVLAPQPVQEPPEPLRRSLQRVGILHPPLLMDLGHGQLIIVSGRGRLLAAASLHQRSCQARVLPPDTKPLETLALLLEEKLFAPHFTIVEQANFLKRVMAWLSPEEASCRFLPILGLPPQINQLQRLLRFTELEEIILVNLHQGRLDQKVSYELLKLGFNDRFAIFEIITSLQLSVSNQKKLLIASRELASRRGLAIHELLATQAAQEILNQSGNIPQISKQLFSWLQGQRFPRSEAAEAEFSSFVQELGLPKDSSVAHSPYFEKDEVSLTLTFADRDELAEFTDNYLKS